MKRKGKRVLLDMKSQKKNYNKRDREQSKRIGEKGQN